MNKGTKIKWFFIGLGSGWIILAAGSFFLFNLFANQDDPFNGVKPDMGKSLHKFGRPARWQASHMWLGDSGFKAAAGPHRYEDEDDKEWDYYSIDVEKPDGDSFYVYFQRDFHISEIPDSLLGMKVQDIAEYDEKSRMVTFEIGEKTFTYELPNR